MNTVFTFLDSMKELIVVWIGFAAFALLYLYLSIPHIDTVLSQDIPSDMICTENWLKVYGCKRKEDLMFAHRYN
jgi:hypothetical protein